MFVSTNEGALQYTNINNAALNFFSKAGSMLDKRKSFYGNEDDILKLFETSWYENQIIAMQLLFWLRNCRGGAGNRSGFRKCLQWIATRYPYWIIANIELIPHYGRWDDLRILFDTPVKKEAAKLWANALKENNVLAAKWADRKDVLIKHALGIKKEGDFRKFLSNIRKNAIVEHKMTFKNYDQIEYPKVPSVAMARYSNAFRKNDLARFNQFKASLISGEKTINASALFPHDCVRTALNGDTEIADAQFDALPNYLEDTNEKIIVIADSSGSMGIAVSGSVTALHISVGLALYCSSKIPKDNPFYKKFITFENESEFQFWDNMTFSEAIHNDKLFDGKIGATRIDKALDSILNTAQLFNIKQSDMPTALLIVSDMQFTSALNSNNYTFNSETVMTEVEQSLEKWKNAGYKIPQIIYWNTAGYAGSTIDNVLKNNVALISGFSPSILKTIFKGSDVNPMSIMLNTLDEYKIKRPD